MKKVTIEIETVNSAFDENPGSEVEDVLSHIKDLINTLHNTIHELGSCPLYGSDDNLVGKITIE